MTEQQFTELLKKLKIPTNNRSYADIFDLLDAKLSEYLDRQDAESQELIDDIQDALDYAELKKNEVGSGIALKREKPVSKDTLDMDELRGASEKARKEQERINSANTGATNAGALNAGAASAAAAGAASGAGASAAASQPVSLAGQQAGNLWFASLTGADNINTMFYQAVDDLKYGEFNHAKSILEAILQVEPNNAGAYLGKALAGFQMKELRELALAYDKDVFAEINIRRAYDHGNATQKKYLDDLKKELENGKKYMKADKLAQNNTSQPDLSEAKNRFLELGSYRDAAQRAKQCEDRILELKYERAVNERSNARDAEGFRAAADLFGRLSGYRDADKQARECEEKAKEKEAAAAEWERTEGIRKGYKEAQKAFQDMESSYRGGLQRAINQGSTTDNYDISRLEGRLKEWKDYIGRNPELKKLLSTTDSDIHSAEKALEEVRKLVKQYKKAASAKKREELSDEFWIVLFAVLFFLCGVPGEDIYSRGLGTFLPLHAAEQFLSIEDAKSPYIMSLSNIDSLYLEDSDNVRKLFLPFAGLEGLSLSGGDYSRLDIPNSVKTLELRNCAVMDIPNSVKTLELRNCAVMEIPDTVEEIQFSFGASEEYEYGGIDFGDYELPENLRVLGIGQSSEIHLVIPEGVEELGLYKCDSLQSLQLPSTLKKISFSNIFLPSIDIPEGVEVVYIDSPYGTLQELTLPSTLKEVTINHAYNLTTLSLSEGVEKIRLYNLTRLESVVIPESAKNVSIERCNQVPNMEYKEE